MREVIMRLTTKPLKKDVYAEIVQELVRCEYCEYSHEENEFERWCYGFGSPARLVRKDDFCSHGKRR